MTFLIPSLKLSKFLYCCPHSKINLKKEKEKVKRLTPFQEREVSARLGQGLTYEQIATLFGRAHGTVNNDFYKIHKILKIHRTCELASQFAKYRKLYPERIRCFT